MLRIKDRLTLGVVSGLSANLLKEALAETFYGLGIAKATCRRMAPYLILSPQQAETSAGKVVGAAMDATIAAMSGVLVTYLLTFTGKDHMILKGMAVGNGLLDPWFGAWAKSLNKPGPLNAGSNLACRVVHGVFGIATAFLVTRLGDPTLFPPSKTTMSTQGERVNSMSARFVPWSD